MIEYLSLQKVTQKYEPELLQAAADVIKSGIYLYGGQVKGFEREFAAYCGTTQCVGVANGLDALTLALMAYKALGHWNDGDEVIVSANTFVASFLAVVRAGLKPVACDVDAGDFLLSPAALESLVTPRTRAVVAVHIYGAVCDMEAIVQVARRHGLKVIEDAAQAHGAVWQGRKAGAWGDAAAFSFYPAKNLGALSDAGAVTSCDAEFAALVRVIANYGSDVKYHHTHLGVNSRIDELQSAFLRVKLKHLDDVNARRREIAAAYNRGIVNPLVVKPYGGDAGRSVFHVYPLRCSCRDRLQQFMLEAGVRTLVHYPVAPHLQPSLKALLSGTVAPVAESICATELSIPINSTMTDGEVAEVIDVINRFE
jgi:dTDP-4-amino-4,6-dideoxygalactose transaminase